MLGVDSLQGGLAEGNRISNLKTLFLGAPTRPQLSHLNTQLDINLLFPGHHRPPRPPFVMKTSAASKQADGESSPRYSPAMVATLQKPSSQTPSRAAKFFKKQSVLFFLVRLPVLKVVPIGEWNHG